MSMANEKQPADLRCAVLYCFQSYLYNNEVAKTKVSVTDTHFILDVASDFMQYTK